MESRQHAQGGPDGAPQRLATGPWPIGDARDAPSCVLLSAAFAVVTALLLLYVLHFYRAYFSSDDAVVNTLARAMWEQGTLLPRGWINNNGDLMVPSGALVVAPLLRWLPNGYFAHALAGVFAVVFMLASQAYLLRVMGIPLLPALLLLTMVASGFSSDMAVVIFTQTTYVWWTAGFFLCSAIIVVHRRVHPAGGRAGWLRIGLLFGLVFCISFANPGRVALMLVLPLYLFDLGLRWSALPGSVRAQGVLRTLGIDDALATVGLVAAFALAWLLYSAFKKAGVTEMSYGAAALRWGGWPSVWRHLATFGGWFDYLGAGRSMAWDFSAAAIARGFRFLTGGWLIWIAVSEVALLRRHAEPVRRALVFAFVGSFVPIFAIYTLFEPLAISAGTLRYFNVPIFILVALGAFQLRDLVRVWPRAGATLLVVLGMAAVPAAAKLYLPADVSAAGFWEVKPSRQQRLADLLQKEGLRWGYATWWNAGATEVLSDSAVRVLPVDVGANGLSLNLFMASRRWYEPSAWRGESFLALAREEARDAWRGSIDVMLGEPTRVVHSPDYEVLVYGHNIAADLACQTTWSMSEPVAAVGASMRVTAARWLHARDARRARVLSVTLRNGGQLPVSGSGRYPMSVGIRLLDAAGVEIAPNWVHSPLRCPLPAGQERTVLIAVPEAPARAARLRIDIVQEGVAWFGDRGVPWIPLDLPARD